MSNTWANILGAQQTRSCRIAKLNYTHSDFTSDTSLFLWVMLFVKVLEKCNEHKCNGMVWWVSGQHAPKPVLTLNVLTLGHFDLVHSDSGMFGPLNTFTLDVPLILSAHAYHITHTLIYIDLLLVKGLQQVYTYNTSSLSTSSLKFVVELLFAYK